MSDQSQGAGWWLASDGKWYPPESFSPPPPPPPIPPDGNPKTPSVWMTPETARVLKGVGLAVAAIVAWVAGRVIWDSIF
jgi:hypothetical protein